MEIREARRDEASAIAAAVGEQGLFARYGATIDGLSRSLEGALSRGEPVLVAEESGAIAGFAWFLPSGTLSLGGYLRLIAVAPGQEGRGTGGQLLDEVERRTSASSRHLFLLVTRDNDGARRFYAGRGYTEVGPLPSLVKPGLDEVLMWKVLR
jgi:ribosomal protein S18 acetylase RimI-like enzyme